MKIFLQAAGALIQKTKRMKSISFALFFFALVGFDNMPPARTTACLSSEEKKLYDIIMEYRKENKLEPIPLSENLSYVAQTHAHDLMENYKFDVSNVCNPHSWSAKGKWSACCYTSDHKQSACMWAKPKELTGYPGNGYEILYYSTAGATAQEGLDGWKVSPAHNPLIINSGIWANAKWKAIGIGIYGTYGMVWFGDEPDLAAPSLCKP
jgi:uncharacterized protein YkwD